MYQHQTVSKDSNEQQEILKVKIKEKDNHLKYMEPYSLQSSFTYSLCLILTTLTGRENSIAVNVDAKLLLFSP